MRIYCHLANGCLAAAIFTAALWAGCATGVQDRIFNAVYLIERQPVQLLNGRAESPAAPGSAAKIVTRSFGDPVFGDLNGDGREDAALLLVQETGGSGTFYYVAAAMARNGVYEGTNAIFLGDRIVPRTIDVRNGVILAAYDDRHPHQPMAARPTVSKTMHLTVRDGHLGVVGKE